MARSMLSLGTDWALAFAIASASVGLPAGSPPPTRAATSTPLMSLANSLPRFASTKAFLCLVVAHFEWPLMQRSLTARIGPAMRSDPPTRSSLHCARSARRRPGRPRMRPRAAWDGAPNPAAIRTNSWWIRQSPVSSG